MKGHTTKIRHDIVFSESRTATVYSSGGDLHTVKCEDLDQSQTRYKSFRTNGRDRAEKFADAFVSGNADLPESGVDSSSDASHLEVIMDDLL